MTRLANAAGTRGIAPRVERLVLPSRSRSRSLISPLLPGMG
jgi:hypothetical protein